MASVNEWIVREYFEMLGFLVRQPRKYEARSRTQVQVEEEADLLVVNPSDEASAIPGIGVWDAQTLRHVSRAVVGIRGWHSERFSPAVLKQAPEVYRFADEAVLDFAKGELGEGPVARILCLSELPAAKPMQEESLAALKAEGIDGVLLYPHILFELIQHVEINRNYDKSDLLQLIRILKNYGLFKDSQLELFSKGGKR
jgi:hypothetical protein